MKIIVGKFDGVCSFVYARVLRRTQVVQVWQILVISIITIYLSLLAVDELEREVLHVRLVDPRVNVAHTHIFIFLVLVVKLLICFLTLNIYAVEMEFFTLTRLIAQLRTSLVLDHVLGEPEGLGVAAVAAHGEFEVGDSLLGALELDDGVNEVHLAVKLNHQAIIVIVKEIALVDRIVSVGARLNLSRHLLVLLVWSVNAREHVPNRRGRRTFAIVQCTFQCIVRCWVAKHCVPVYLS